MSNQLKLISINYTYEYKLTPNQIAAASKAYAEPFGLVGHKLAHDIMRLNKANARFGEYDISIHFWCGEGQTDGVVQMIEQALGKPNE